MNPTRSRLLALAFTVLASASVATPARATQSQPAPPVGPARLQGTFRLTGRVTVAHHVPGEHVGQVLTRLWSFTPLCPTGPCTTVALLRARSGGGDALLLRQQAVGFYTGRGSFYLPLRCAGRLYPDGEQVPFMVTVQVTGGAVVNGSVVAANLTATYRNRSRRNLTPCVAVLGHDAATYQGSPVPPAPPAG